ncbi:unnamed protein product [Ambrosiozyma monospora]|uniref:Unnamed protein product n=1 Tax=Ambrosiozyma monospora TaxID=43982 RepID=A0ACB5TSI7_AMBMO|nr:unnamed protein product [Ambrosiozyma monospora]
MPLILNAAELNDLDEVIIILHPTSVHLDVIDEIDGWDEVIDEFLKIEYTCSLPQLREFISQFPSSLGLFEIKSKGYLGVDLDSYCLCCPDN